MVYYCYYKFVVKLYTCNFINVNKKIISNYSCKFGIKIFLVLIYVNDIIKIELMFPTTLMLARQVYLKNVLFATIGVFRIKDLGSTICQ